MSTIFGCCGHPDPAAATGRADVALADLNVVDRHRCVGLKGEFVALAHGADDRGCAIEIDGWHCMVDARIDNAAELQERLGRHGTTLPADAGSAALVLACYRAVGNQAWDWLRGDFACAIWHSLDDLLVLARDVSGARPLYWGRFGGAICFSSELRGLLALGQANVSLDLEQVHRHLYRGGSGAAEPNRSFVDGVMRIAPGTWCQWQSGLHSEARYWDPRRLPALSDLSVEQAASELRTTIVTAVRRRAQVDGGIGCHLSGGLDCSSIAAILWGERQTMAQTPLLYSWTPRAAVPSDADELQRIDRLTAMHQWSVRYLDAEQFSASRAEIADLSLDLRYPWNSLGLERQILADADRAGVRHIMSGWGGDEAASHQGIGLAPELLIRGRWLALASHLRAARSQKTRSALRAVLGRVRRDLLAPMIASLQRPTAVTVASSALRSRFSYRPSRASILGQGLSVRQTQLWRYFDGYLSDRIESWYCHGKLKGVTYSYPLLDRDVLEFAYRLPGHHFAAGGMGRTIFRRAMAPFWPAGATWEVPKSETGLMGYLRSGGAKDDRRSVAAADLMCKQDNALNRDLFDHGLLEQLTGRISQRAELIDLELLGRADWIARLAQRLENNR